MMILGSASDGQSNGPVLKDIMASAAGERPGADRKRRACSVKCASLDDQAHVSFAKSSKLLKFHILKEQDLP
jgi:hypothetical protein